MAETVIASGDLLAQQLWSKKMMAAALNATKASLFMGKDQSAMAYVVDDPTKNAGAVVTMGLRMQLTGTGVVGDGAIAAAPVAITGSMEGNEEAMVFRNDSVIINQLRNAVRIRGAVSQQRVPWSMRQQAMAALADWYADRIDNALLQQLCGNTAMVDANHVYRGLQAATVPTKFVVGGTGNLAATAILSEAGLAAGDNFTLSMIIKAKILAQTNSIPMRPIRVGGMDVYVAFLHPYQVAQLKLDVTANQWYDIQKAAMQGGQITGNPIFTGALGMHDGVIIHEDIRVPWGDSAQGRVGSNLGAAAVGVTDVARGVLCGAQAVNIAFGREAGWPYQMKWVEELFDYQNQLGVACGLIWGAKKAVMKDSAGANGVDIGCVTMSSSSPAVTGG
jgi:N4-gp56 family major capsid protein